MTNRLPDHPLQIRLGERVRKLRTSRGLSQEVLAARADLDRTYISGIERGVRNVSLRNLHSIALALDLTLSELFHGIEGDDEHS